MGIQDFDPVVQKAVNRFNTVEQVRELVDSARELKFHSISMDLIYGLPHQSWESFSRTLDDVIDLNPDRLSVFNYAHMPHLFKTQKQIDENALPAPEVKLEMMRLCTEKLLAAGYVFIGMDHFAKPDDELAVAQRDGKLQRNFQGYSTHGDCDLFAFGVSSISGISNTFAQNHKDIESYYESIDNGHLPLARGFTLSADDLLRKEVITQLICLFKLNFKDIEQQFGIVFVDYFADELTELESMREDGLITIDGQGIAVTAAGRLLIRRICMQFDAYAKKASNQIRYSKII
jgi:oxygen-independent coproporphyrinogen-3 oxidase